MPRRRNIERVATPEAQGDDSWVEVSRPTWKEIKQARNITTGENADADSFALGEELIKKHLLKWNWVDDNDEPLPQPSDIEDPLDLLTDIEVKAISDVLTRDVEAKK